MVIDEKLYDFINDGDVALRAGAKPKPVPKYIAEPLVRFKNVKKKCWRGRYFAAL
jgi:hypothetical protein|tara:strand:- start:1316 stop:1480 length:165 start_codon:yes stop_codon:yes gene_type:complete